MYMKESKREDLLRYYETELDYFRLAGAAFAKKYPKIASRLELSSSQSGDPHVERLIEAFAFLTARIQYNIDSEFPEISFALLDNLYPHFLEPIPAFSVARFVLDSKANFTSGLRVERDSQLLAQLGEGYSINMRTTYPVTLYPFEVSDVAVCSPAMFHQVKRYDDAEAVINVSLQSSKVPFPQIDCSELRFYLGGNKSVSYELYELLTTQLLDIGLHNPENDTVVWIGKESLREVGFEDDENILPSRPTSHPQYRLLQEYFAFPEKFLFIDVQNLDRRTVKNDKLQLLFVLKNMIQEHRLVTSDNFLLYCTPIVNLFPKVSEPLFVDHKSMQYKLTADLRRDLLTEIHSITSITGSMDTKAETHVLRPFFSLHHGSRVAASDKAYWYARRVPTNRKDKPGTEMYVSFVDKEFNPSRSTGGTVYGHVLCTNRHLAQSLPERSVLQTEVKGLPVSKIFCLHQPTKQLDPPLSGSLRWRLISHLSMNYISLSNPQTALSALKEMLRLYNINDEPYIERQIDAITAMNIRAIVKRVGNLDAFGYVRGKEINITFNEENFAGSSALLLGRILHEFYQLHERVNSFTQVQVNGIKKTEVWKSWKPDIQVV